MSVIITYLIKIFRINEKKYRNNENIIKLIYLIYYNY